MNRVQLISYMKSVIFPNSSNQIDATKHQALEERILTDVMVKSDDIISDEANKSSTTVFSSEYESAQFALKQDKSTEIVVDASTIESYDNTKLDGYLAGNVFVSYINPSSTDPDLDYKKLFIYQCVVDAAMGESPETHPLKWTRIGETMTYVSSTTATGHVTQLAQMYAITGMKDGHTVAVLNPIASVYKYSAAAGKWNYFCELKPVVVQVPGISTTAVMSQKAVTDAIAAASGGGSGLASTWEPNIAAIRALTSHNTGNDVGDYATLNIYEYDATLTNAEDEDNTYLKPDNVTGAGRWFKRKQLALKSEVPIAKQYQISAQGTTTGLLSISQLEKIVSIPSKYNVDSLKMTPVLGGADIILITAGVVASLPINLSIATYNITIVYTIGTSVASLIIETQKQ